MIINKYRYIQPIRIVENVCKTNKEKDFTKDNKTFSDYLYLAKNKKK